MRIAAAARDWIDALRDRAVASDPGLMRLRFAGRVVIAVGLTAAVLAVIGRFVSFPLPALALGFIVSLFASVGVQDPEPEQRRLTTLMMPLPALASFTVAGLLASTQVLADLVFLLLIFTAVAARRFGPRWTGLGMISFTSFFLGEYLHPPLSLLPFDAVALAVGAANVYLVRFVLLRDRPDRALARILTAIERRIAVILRQIRAALDDGGWAARGRRRLAQDIVGLNEAVLLAEMQLAALHDVPRPDGFYELGPHLFALELAAERVAARAVAELPTDGAPRALLGWIRALEGRFRHETRSAAPTGCTISKLMGRGAPDGLTAALQELEAAHERLPDRRDLRVPAAGRLDAAEPGIGGPGAAGSAAGGDRGWLGPGTRQAIQATLACGLAIACGELISATRWYWAVITAFIVFSGTGSRGATLLKGVQRLLGTLAGVVAGVLIATALAGDRRLELGLLFPCVFLAFYVFRVSYAAMIFWFTILVALLYGAMGFFSESLLILRLEETAVGAAAGTLVATFVFPVRTRDSVRDAAEVFLRTLDEVVAQSVRRLLDRDADSPLEASRAHDRGFQGLRNAAGPLTLGWGLLAPGATGRALAILNGCSYWARELSFLSRGAPVRDPDIAAALSGAGDRIRAHIAALCRTLRCGGPLALAPPDGSFDYAEELVAGRDRLLAVVQALGHLDRALRRYAECFGPDAAGATRDTPQK